MYSSVLLFLNIGSGELVVIILVALMLFGGNKLPEIARGLGRGIRDFKDASEGVKREIHNQINNYEPSKPTETKKVGLETGPGDFNVDDTEESSNKEESPETTKNEQY